MTFILRIAVFQPEFHESNQTSYTLRICVKFTVPSDKHLINAIKPREGNNIPFHDLRQVQTKSPVTKEQWKKTVIEFLLSWKEPLTRIGL